MFAFTSDIAARSGSASPASRSRSSRVTARYSSPMSFLLFSLGRCAIGNGVAADLDGADHRRAGGLRGRAALAPVQHDGGIDLAADVARPQTAEKILQPRRIYHTGVQIPTYSS